MHFAVLLVLSSTCKNACQLVKDRLVEHRQKEKASYSGLFDKGPMYNDKEVLFVHCYYTAVYYPCISFLH